MKACIWAVYVWPLFLFIGLLTIVFLLLTFNIPLFFASLEFGIRVKRARTKYSRDCVVMTIVVVVVFFFF